MNSDKLKLFELLKANEAAGTIHFEHRRMLVLDADAIGLLRKELIGTLGLDRARRIFMRFGYACGYRDALSTKEWQSPNSIAEWWSLGPRLHAVEGLVHVQILHSVIDKAAGVFKVEAEWRNSYEAEQHQAHLGGSDSPVCWMLVGYASGHSSAVFGRDVFYYETECVGKGDARCHVVGGVANGSDKWVCALKGDYEGENIQAEFGRLLTALDQHERTLKHQQVKVSDLEAQLASLREAIKQSVHADEMVGQSTGFRKIIKEVERIASSDVTVLIQGETGTGKDMIARLLHARSDRSGRPFIIVNCAALPASLAESELFGHEKGAFTGAFQRKPGRFEIADGGTIFLDEVGELPLELQAKFLRVLQQSEFERVGGIQRLKVDVRVLAATNQSLEKLVAEGKFRADLFYRLNVFPIHLPPLRERPDDLMVLACYFVEQYSIRFRKTIASIDQQSMEQLQQYSWPGNVRELEHVIERAVLLAEDDVLTLDESFRGREAVGASVPLSNGPARRSLKTLAQFERLYIEEVLRHTNGALAGKGGAAEILGLPSSTLRHRMKKLGLK